MREITYTHHDKSKWDDGPWMNEPDKIQWQDKATGLPCLAVRNCHAGHWCGYVGVDKDHPFFEEDYDNTELEVHGGLTFAAKCDEPEEGFGDCDTVCHIVDKGEDDNIWWFGFDCAHLWDMCPGRVGKHFNEDKSVYKTIAFVRKECATLAHQLKNTGVA